MLSEQIRAVAWMLIAALGFAACQIAPTLPVDAMSPEAQRVSQTLAMWPEVAPGRTGLKRPFFTTIHAAGKRTTASGILEYHGPRDFRITAVTELGVILFDARFNWAGVTVLRQMPGLDKPIVESLVRDLSVAFHLPSSLAGLAVKGKALVLRRTEADTDRYTWTFDEPTGRLREIDADRSAFDTLRIEYLRYNTLGWPEELALTRKARLYAISLTFTDGSMVRRDGGTSEQNQ